MSGTAPVILGMLQLGLRTGYEIKSFMDKSTRFFWAASFGQIYPELRRLEQRGLIRSEPDLSDGRGRRNYELTEAGEDALGGWLAPAGDELYELRDERLLKLFFADFAPREALELVRAKRAYHERVLERMREIEPAAASGDRGHFPYLVLRYGLAMHQWAVEWCEEAEQELRDVRRAG